MLNPEILKYIDQSVLCWLATSSLDLMPNVSPKEVFCAYGADSILIANIASPQSLKNCKANPQASVSFVDVFVQKGFQLKGRVTILEKGDENFAECAAPLLQITEGKYPFNEIFSLKIEKVKPILAPNYILQPDITEEAQVESAMRNYGVKKA